MENAHLVFIGAEFCPDEGAEMRRESLPSEIQKLGNSCHVMSFGWVVQSAHSVEQIFRQIVASQAIGEHDRLVVIPIAPAEPKADPWDSDKERWQVQNGPTAAMCFKM